MASSENPLPQSHSGLRRWGRAQLDETPDTYQLHGKIPEPATCPQCGAVYQAGRWTWPESPVGGDKVLCQACRRINDHYPAGIVTLSGAFAIQHKDEILNLVRHQEVAERSDHPLNRIMEIEEKPDHIVVNTTDIHLPRRIGEACERAFDGKLEIRYDQDAYFVRVDWTRES